MKLKKKKLLFLRNKTFRVFIILFFVVVVEV